MNMKPQSKCVLLSIAFFLFLISCDAANILVVVPFTSTSHYKFLRPIGLELARRGHNVTVITAHREDNPPAGYNQVMAEDVKIWDGVDGGRPNVFEMVDQSFEKFKEIILWNGGLFTTENTLKSKEVIEFMSKDNHFDLVISELFYQEALYMFAHMYKAPLALVTTYGNCMRNNFILRNPMQLATLVHEFAAVRNPRSFVGRLTNLYYSLYDLFWFYNWYLPKQEELASKYFQNVTKPVPTLEELQRNVSLVLMNSHFSTDVAAAYYPNFVEIGGLHIKEFDKKLPQVHYRDVSLPYIDDLITPQMLIHFTASLMILCGIPGTPFFADKSDARRRNKYLIDLQEFLDGAEHGVVYVNFGSNVRSAELPAAKRDAFLAVFRRLRQRVLWKWEDERLPGQPDNLLVRDWLPQKEILSHPNVKVFIAHGGLIGFQEATFYGVPIIGVPIYADQYNNLLQAQEEGYGMILEYHDINEETLESAINEMVKHKYKINAIDVSKRFVDRPMSALNSSTYWIEYVIRHKGAAFMRNPALQLSWFAYAMLDVYAFLLAVSLVGIGISYKIIKMILHFDSKSLKVKSS